MIPFSSVVMQLSKICSFVGEKILVRFPHTTNVDEEMVRRGIRVHLQVGYLTQKEWDDICSFAIEHQGEVIRISEGMIDLESLHLYNNLIHHIFTSQAKRVRFRVDGGTQFST